MKKLLFLFVCLGSFLLPATPPLRFGVFADIQYADQNDLAGRHYRMGIQNTSALVDKMNQEKVDFVLNLGDTIDNNWKSFAPILAELQQLNMPLYSILGNHDFSVAPQYRWRATALLNMPSAYYQFRHESWRFLALDTNLLSLYAHAPDSPLAKQMKEHIEKEFPEECKYKFNGGYSQEQLLWIDQQLADAADKGDKVVLFQHCPVIPGGQVPAALNSDALLEIIDRYPGTVKLSLAGHHHAGGEFIRNDVLYLTIKGQVESEVATGVIVELTEESILIHGFGNEKDRTFPLQ